MRVFVVEDHPKVRELMVRSLDGVPEIEVAGVAVSAEEALEYFPENVDVALIDLSLPGADGLTLLRHLNMSYPALRCLIVTAESDDLYVQRAFREGAHGYLNKEDILDLEKAVKVVAAGERFISEAQREGPLSTSALSGSIRPG